MKLAKEREEFKMNVKFITIRVDSLVESLKFYQDVLGFKEIRRIDNIENITMVFLQASEGGIIELVHNKSLPQTRETTDQHMVSFGISVENMNDIISLLEKHNQSLEKGPITTPGGEVIAFMKDPNGVEIEFIEGFKI